MEEKVALTGNCVQCSKPFNVEVNMADWVNYTKHGVLAQNAFPYLNSGERELIITSMCETCFDNMFK